jgi:sulfate transport system permease protein
MIARVSLRFVALAYLAVLLLLPVGLVAERTFARGFGPPWHEVTNPDALHALKLTLLVAAIAVPLNTVFGIVCALLIVRHRFPGVGALNALVDLPIAVSPVIVGLIIFILYGRTGWLGPALTAHGIHVLFALPSMVLATMFVSLPFVVREVVPVLREIGTDQEQAAATLGAKPLAIFRRVTLPSIRWAVSYGVVVTTARAIGEFGAVSIVSGAIVGQTETMTLRIQGRVENFDMVGAYADSIVLASIAILTLVTMNRLRPKEGAQS